MTGLVTIKASTVQEIIGAFNGLSTYEFVISAYPALPVFPLLQAKCISAWG